MLFSKLFRIPWITNISESVLLISIPAEPRKTWNSNIRGFSENIKGVSN